MATDGAPKSAFELAMERLRKKDAEAGIVEHPLTDAQRDEIAEVRRVHEARVAERRIMHDSAVRGTMDPAEIAERDAELRRDLDRFEREREEKVRKIRER
jgi:hypothetical protein